ncbi:MAG: ribose-phosphate pyrophosphokinase-like domain-containing protein, partial [Myxococcota bacterium]
MTPCIVFSTERYRYLGDMLCADHGFEAGALVRQTFPDGERYRRIEAEVAGRDVMLLGGTVDEADTLELYDLACALVHRGVH